MPVPQRIGPNSRIVLYPEASPDTDPQGVASIAVGTAGTGYTVAPSVTVADPTGQGFAGHVVLSSGGAGSVVVDDAGYGYTSPVATFSGGDGSGAVAGATTLGAPQGFILPIDGPDTFFSTAPLQEAPVFMGPPGEAPSTVPGEIGAAGATNMGLEFLISGFLLKAFMGSSTAPVATAGGQLHYFPLAAPPGTVQLQKEWLDGVAQYLRNKGVYLDTLTLPTSTSGAQKLQPSWMGYGDELNTATDGSAANLGGTKTNLGYSATSSFYGSLYYKGTSLATVVSFPPALSRKISRQSVAYNGGIAGALNAGLVRAQGALELMYTTSRNLQDYDDAIQGTPLSLEVVWADKRLASVGAFLYLALPQVIMERRGPAVGGEVGFTFPQNFRLVFDQTASALAAFILSGLGPYTFVAATSDTLGVKIDGGSTQPISMVTGSPQTAAQVVATINGTLTGGVAEVFPGSAAGVGGRFRIKSNTKGAGGSVQVITGTTHSAHTVLGFDGVTRAGKAATSMHAFLFNSRNLQY